MCGVNGIECSFSFKSSNHFGWKWTRHICGNLSVPYTICCNHFTFHFVPFLCAFVLSSSSAWTSMSSSKIEPYWRRFIIVLWTLFSLLSPALSKERKNRVQKNLFDFFFRGKCRCNVIRIWFHSFFLVRKCKTHDTVYFFKVKKECIKEPLVRLLFV